MSYLNLNDIKFEEDLIIRKEFIENEYLTSDNNLYAHKLEDAIKKQNKLELTNYQKFVTNFINPNTKFDRLLLIHSTGVGKTITALSTAINFINIYKQERLIDKNELTGMIYIIGFTKHVFKKELFSRPEFGIVNTKEIEEMTNLKMQILKFNETKDILKLKDLKMKYSGRLKSKKGNGFFEFIGYKELVNKLITKNELDVKLQLNNIRSEKEFNYLIDQGIIKLNLDFINKFNKSLIICDEIHNVYNSLDTNNWGMSLNIIFNYYKNKNSLRVLFLSATPINNNPIEIISLLRLLNDDLDINKKDIFDTSNNIKLNGYNIIKKNIIGKVSFLKDMDISSYPSKEIYGTSIKDIPYLKFIKCPMSNLHFKTYENVSKEYSIEKNINYVEDDETVNINEVIDEIKTINKSLIKYPINLELDRRFLNDFVLPKPNSQNIGMFLKSEIIKELQNASREWKNSNGVGLITNNKLFKNAITGEILLEKNIKKYSTKFYTMLEIIKDIILNDKGKIFLYHNFIQVSGINLIAEILKINGFISIDEQPNKFSRCNICYQLKNETHKNHEFIPIKFMTVNSLIHKNIIDKQLDSFNLRNNIKGEEIRIIIGSKAIKESYNLKAIQNLLVLHQPDNISTLIQIFGRAIRKNSHMYLNPENKKVNIYILVSTIPKHIQDKSKKYIYSYEEMKYKYKLQIYKVIQKLMNIFIENAIDRNINYNINFPKYEIFDNNDLYNIDPFNKKQLIKINYNKINLSTFQSFYYQDEINYCKYIIKRLFIENSKVWKYNDLLKAIREPGFKTNIQTNLISEYSIIIALDFLVYNKNKNATSPAIIETSKNGTESNKYEKDNIESSNDLLVSNLFNSDEKYIIDLANNVNIIMYINEYYILIPYTTNSQNLDISNVFNNIEYDIIYNTYEHIPEKHINLNKILDSDFKLNNYDYVKEQFIKKYSQIKIEKLFNIISEFDFNFHLQLIEEIIDYFFNLYTDQNYKVSVNHDFYLKLLYFYNKFNIIIFANKADQDLLDIYGKYILSTSHMNFTISDNDSDNHNYANLLTQLSSESQSSSDGDNKFYFNFYNQAVTEVSNYLLTKKKQIKIFDYLLPIGHIYDDKIKFYHPSKYWFNKLDYNKINIKFKENNIIIGYLEKSKIGFDINFKLRYPKKINNSDNKVSSKVDLRNVETGLNCLNKDKNELITICKKLKINLNNIKLRKTKLCNLIKTELINLEINERKKMSNIKYFYFYWEK
jgi:superfamily II DNA or RNA helicase